MQKDIEKNRTALITERKQLAAKKVTVEEQINRELDGRSVNSIERTSRVILQVNASDLEDFVQEQDRPAENQENSEDYHESIHSSRLHTRQNQIENDLWRQLKRVCIPTFSGDKRNYEARRAAFMVCKKHQHQPSTSCFYSVSSGEALRVIESLGHPVTAYQTAT